MSSNDISKKINSIEEVQESEINAKKLVEKAQANAALTISDAKTNAAKSISYAEAESKKRMSDEISKIINDEEKRFESALDKSAKEAKAISFKRLSAPSIDRLALEISRDILGE